MELTSKLDSVMPPREGLTKLRANGVNRIELVEHRFSLEQRSVRCAFVLGHSVLHGARVKGRVSRHGDCPQVTAYVV